MRDVIVIGAGGGGPVVAKELAARGLDVLLLEAGARHADPEREWTHFTNDANHPFTGYFRFGPADRSRPAWRRELPQNSAISQSSGVGGSTQHYYANSPRAMPGAFLDYAGRTATPTIRPTCSRLATANLSLITSGWSLHCRCRPRRWAQRKRSSTAARRVWDCRCRPPRTSPGLPFARRRTPSSSRAERPGKTNDQRQTRLPAGAGLYLLRPLPPGVLRAPGRAAQSEGQALDR